MKRGNNMWNEPEDETYVATTLDIIVLIGGVFVLMLVIATFAGYCDFVYRLIDAARSRF